MIKYSSIFVAVLILMFANPSLEAQDTKFEFIGDIRIGHVGSSLDASGLGGDNTLLRFRPGIRFSVDENHSFVSRLAYLVSKEFEPLALTVQANGNSALAYGSLTFDEFYYQFQNEKNSLKIGRFQNTQDVLSNARRSNLRFQSNAIFVHWSDGIHFKTNFENNWYGEAILEYQNRGNLTYPYGGSLDFGNADHNFTSYFGFENRERDSRNIIHKGFGLFIAPNAYQVSGDYSTYVALSSRIAIDIPQRDLLNGGSFRFAGELGQNLNADFSEGTSAVISAGINSFADKHEFMIEFAKTDSEWLTPTPFFENSDDVEFRYRFFYSQKLNFDARYRVRQVRVAGAAAAYSTFIRATYRF